MRLFLSLLLLLTLDRAFCQNNACELSPAIDLPQQGWNKLVMMRNGNTVLLHMELNKPLTVKVFNKEHKEIASEKHVCDVLDIRILDHAIYKGFYDINGEAVLFMQQTIDRKESLVRIRFNAETGKIIEEKMMLHSASFNNKTDYSVLKQSGVDSYAVFCFRSTIWHPETIPEILYYNVKHESYDTVAIKIDVTNFRWMDFVGADLDVYGNTCITIYLADLDVTGAAPRTAFNNDPNTYKKYLAFLYVPKNSRKCISTSVRLSNNVRPSYTNFSYNPFAKSLNVLLLHSKNELIQNGVNAAAVNNRSSLLFVIDGSNLSLNYKWMTYNKVDNIIYQNDTTKQFPGVPVKMFTANNGLTTLVSEEYVRSNDIENGYTIPITKTGTIAITQLDDNGAELSAAIIPKAQFVRDDLYPETLSHRDVSKNMFIRRGYKNLPQNDFVNAFTSINCYESGKNLFIVYNDDKRNFSSTVTAVDSVYDFTYTDGIYCQVNRKNEINKHFLFGAPGENESKSGVVESACFDDKSNTYATLMLYRKGKDITTHIAWCHLE